MVVGQMFEPPDLLVATISGLVTADDQACLVAWVRKVLRDLGEVRLLVVLDRFDGWRPESSFSNVGLWLRDDEGVSRIAIVGNARWRLSALTFIAQPVRRTPIEYFDTEAAARQWLLSGKEPSVEPVM